MIIGVAGQFRQGKDVVADHLSARLGLGRAAFAANVKRIFCDSFGVDMDFVERWKTDPDHPPGFKMPARKALQFIGDGFRGIRDDIWIDMLFRQHPSSVVISDVRYRNELLAIKARGGQNILICRPGFMNDDPNDSEAQIRKFVEHFLSEGSEGRVEAEGDLGLVDFFILNDGGIDDLYAKVDALVVPFLKRSGKAKCAAP